MSIINSYAVWNNKGGVGKSTITFHLASRYAELHPNQKVLVLDLCPQANSSMLFLGGGLIGESNVLNLCTEATPKTVVGYLSSVISGGPRAPLPNPFEFIVKCSDFNDSISENMFLLCGDGNLEPMAPAISGAAAAPALTPKIQPWKWVHSIFSELISSVAATDDAADWMVFVDTNPSFSIYTELAVCAAHRLIVPVNADDSSRVATNAMFILLHGQNPPHPIYGTWTFASQAHNHGLNVPVIHVVVGNRLTQYDGASTAFRALSDATADTLFSAYVRHPSYFTRRGLPVDVESFRNIYSVALRDFNTAGVVAAHLGRPLTKMDQGYHMVHGTEVYVSTSRVDECLKALDNLVSLVD